MGEDFFADPEGTREQILAATYRTLRERGYADLTISAIGEEFEKSPSLVYRHYDSKDDLVLACLRFMLEEFEAELTEADFEDPRGRLEEFVGWGLGDAPPEQRRFVSTLVELRSQAVHDAAYREHFTRSDEVFVGYVADVIRAGIDRGEFRECDPVRMAETLVTTMSGAMLRRSTCESEVCLEGVRAGLEGLLESQVYNPDAA